MKVSIIIIIRWLFLEWRVLDKTQIKCSKLVFRKLKALRSNSQAYF